MKRAMTALVMSFAVASVGQVNASQDALVYNPTECANLGSKFGGDQFKMTIGELDILENCAAVMKRMKIDQLRDERAEKLFDREVSAMPSSSNRNIVKRPLLVDSE